MQIQVNSDNHIQGNIRLEQWVRSTVESTLERFDDGVTRVEVHLRDENGDKPGPHDKRCQMEARPKGHHPISVTHKAATLEQAIEGAASKLNNALEHFYGKLRSKRAVTQQEISANDALLQEEFLERLG
ncbi:HPF/RaiA family ribosome-associated protein [Pseudomonas putida CSV86]|uniref:Ribosomal subunit interface protein n=2 Tax=Pseudomonas TaxID=286 RepID=A0A177SPD6_PSEPU|nr:MULTISPECIES: HPF/RaiA family ribosome-associated protein [Pseudomonas]MDG9881943.1 HPF/RaiA family ribosome-associated protein [Pseudomonas sp. GD04058]NNJ17443.1 HPF/RaiA family ribosome-associated protein [Pseudomonas bharatica CSV86]OAI92868.1 ribosomal subunit interface protein [Pseudomonas putida]